MSGYVVQVTLIFLLTFLNAHAKKPPGYVAPPKEYDPNPPKYEYGYRIQEDKSNHGKDEQRDGIYAQGRYYVNNGTDSSQSVKYFADDWGYHPVVEYSNSGPYSKSSTNFALGVEAIKLKNNQKFIPQDPNDPGKADNQSKLDPTSQHLDQTVHPSAKNHDPKLILQAQHILQPELEEHQLQVQQDPTSNSHPIPKEPNFSEIQQTPSTVTETPALIESNSIIPVLLQNQPVETVSETHAQNLSPNQPQLLFQNDPHLQLLTNEPHQHFEIRESVIDPSSLPQTVSDPISAHQPPIFYYVQTQQNILPSDGDRFADTLPQFYFPKPSETINISPIEQSPHTSQPLLTMEQSNGQTIQQFDTLPQPQSLIYETKNQEVISNNPSDVTGVTNNNIVENKGNSEQVLETAALLKTPNQIVEFGNSAPENYYHEFGARLNPKYTQVDHNKLIESTKNLVSGDDVLNLNAAVSQDNLPDDGIETSTLQNLLQQYASPSIVSEHPNVDIDHVGVLSSTTVAPPVTTVETSFLKEPIIVAESDSEFHSNKPVTEKTDENKGFYSSTARSTLATSTSKENTESSSDHVLVTPRPVSSKFLAPITAGVQLQHIDEQIFEDSKMVETHNEKEEKVSVEIQKTIPYYLGMYEYPSAYDSQVVEENSTSVEQHAVENIELGKTLLYFPGEKSPKAEKLVGKSPINEQTQILNFESNHLPGQQLPYENKKETFIEDQQVFYGQNELHVQENTGATDEQAKQQLYLQNEQLQEYIKERPTYSYLTAPDVSNFAFQHPGQKNQEGGKSVSYPQPYPVENVVEKQIHAPIEVTKYIDRPYPVPYPQPYPVEKIVQKVVREPYPVEVRVPVERIVERKVPVPYYIEKPVEKIVEKQVPHYIDRPVAVHEPISSQAYLFQIPGLFSQQKYSTLVHNSFQPHNLQLQYSHVNGQKSAAFNQLQPFVYAPQNNQYLPPKQNIPINIEHGPKKLRKLNLLVFPRVNIANLPPITNNPHDLYRNAQSHQSFRYSNAQLNNGYLPPVSQQQNSNCEHNNHLEASASNMNGYSIKKPEEHIGLIPPKRPLFDDSIRSHRNARAHFDDKSIRLEYGFMPPLIPSLEINEQGQPIEKGEK